MQRRIKTAGICRNRRKKRYKPVIRFFAFILLTYLIIAYREKLLKLIYPVLTAVFIAYIIKPFVSILERKGIRKNVSVLVMYAFIILSLAAFVIFAIPRITESLHELSNTLPLVFDAYRVRINNVFDKIRLSAWPEEAKTAVINEAEKLAATMADTISSFFAKSFITVLGAVRFLVTLLLGMITAFYFIKDSERIKKVAILLLPARHSDKLIETGRDINMVLSSFISGQLTVALIVGTLEALGLWLMGIKYPFIMGFFGGISNIIPYFGPFIGAIPAVAVSLAFSPVKALKAALVFIVIQQIDNAFISPRIMEQKLGLHPLITIFAVLAGAEFFGLPGMIFAVPAAAILRILLKRAIGLL